MGAKADKIGAFAELLAAKLADIVLAAGCHLGRGGIPDMRIVRPHDGLAACAMKRQQVLQRLEHVGVAQIPRRARAIIHDAVIALRVGDETRILFGVEEPLAVMLGIGPALCLKVAQRANHVGLAGRIRPGQRGMTIGARDRTARASGSRSVRGRPWPTADRPRRDSSAPSESSCRGCRDRGHETRRARPSPRSRCVCAASHEIAHLGVAPHPGRKAREGRPFRRRILEMPHVMIDARGIRPVRLDGDEPKSLLDDQLAGDALAHPVEFDVPCVASPSSTTRASDPVQQRVEIGASIDGNAFAAIGKIADQRFLARENGRRAAGAFRAGSVPRAPSLPRRSAERSGHRRYPRCDIRLATMRVTRTSSCAR